MKESPCTHTIEYYNSFTQGIAKYNSAKERKALHVYTHTWLYFCLNSKTPKITLVSTLVI